MAHQYSKNPAAVEALTPEQYQVTQKSGTEPAFTGEYWDNHEPGLYVDIEDGYADDPEAVADYVARLDVAGINIEDSSSEALIKPEAHAAKVAAVKSRCPGLFVNARVDTYWLGQGAALRPTLDRGPGGAARDGGPIPAATPYGQMQSRLLAYHRR